MEYMQAKRFLEKYGIRSVDAKYVENADDAEGFAGNSDIALKLISEKALHKSKAGVVKLGLDNGTKIREAYEELAQKGRVLRPYKILAQKMASHGIELILGGKQDSQFGKLILIGLGGIYVEVFKDFALRVCPIKKFDAESMISQIKGSNVITYNGKNRAMLVSLLMKTSKLLEENEIKELDLNPIIVRENSYDAVDLRIIK